MAQINQLALLDTVSSGDQLPVYSSQNGDARRLPISSLLEYFQQTFASPNVATTVYVPTTGFSISLPIPTTQALWVLMQPAGTLATGTITLPLATGVVDGTEILITSTQTITSLTVAGNGATALYGAPTTLLGGSAARLRWYAATNSWYNVDADSSGIYGPNIAAFLANPSSANIAAIGAVPNDDARLVNVNASYFGFVSGPLPSPRTDDQLAALAPDCSAAARNLEDWFANWRERDRKIAVVRFDAGFYAFDYLKFRENSDVFYPRSGLVLQGAGSLATTLQATTSSAAQFIGMDGESNWFRSPGLMNMRVRGATNSNPYQVGVFLNPQFASVLGFGGLTRCDWEDVFVLNFAREQVWLRGGASSYLIPVQYGLWDAVRADALTTTYPAFRFTGQIGPPFIFRNLEAYSARGNNSRAVYVGLDQRTGIPIASVNTVSNCLVFSEPHRLTTTDPFKIEGGTPWGGLTVGTKYWVVRLDDFRLRICTSLVNSQANPPVVVTLTSQTGTATGTSYQEQNIDIGPVQMVLDTPTFQLADVGIEVN